MDQDHSITHSYQTYTDDLGRQVRIPLEPQRIISLCPSQTATLFHFGLGSRIAGRTRFCIHPKPEIEQAVRIGGTKQVNYERIKEIQPDLIIAEKEENTLEMVEELSKEYPVYVTDVRGLPSALKMMRDLGQITGKPESGQLLADTVESRLKTVAPLTSAPSCAYLIWRKPWMAAGSDTFINAMLQQCGLRNIALDWEGRYPEFDLERLADTAPEIVLLSSEPFPFAEKHIQEIASVLPQAKVRLVDGEMFSWYGSHLLHVPDYLAQLLSEITH